jgi:hypothetical protein
MTVPPAGLGGKAQGHADPPSAGTAFAVIRPRKRQRIFGRTFMRALIEREEGLYLVEYALIVAFILAATASRNTYT